MIENTQSMDMTLNSITTNSTLFSVDKYKICEVSIPVIDVYANTENKNNGEYVYYQCLHFNVCPTKSELIEYLYSRYKEEVEKSKHPNWCDYGYGNEYYMYLVESVKKVEEYPILGSSIGNNSFTVPKLLKKKYPLSIHMKDLINLKRR